MREESEPDPVQAFFDACDRAAYNAGSQMAEMENERESQWIKVIFGDGDNPTT